MLDRDLRPAGEEEINRLRGKLATLAREQRADIDESAKLSGEGSQLLDNFNHTNAFKRRFIQLLGYLSTPNDVDQLRIISTRFCGAIFQDIVSMYLSQTLPENVALLNQIRVEEFWQERYQRTDEARLPFENGPLFEGILVPPPDGLLVSDDGEILAICEYSLKGGIKYFNKKRRALGRIKEDLRDIFGETKIEFVVPRHFRHPISADFLIEVPFDHAQFRDYIDSIYALKGIDNLLTKDLPKGVLDQLGILQSFTLDRPVDPNHALVQARGGNLSS